MARLLWLARWSARIRWNWTRLRAASAVLRVIASHLRCHAVRLGMRHARVEASHWHAKCVRIKLMILCLRLVLHSLSRHHWHLRRHGAVLWRQIWLLLRPHRFHGILRYGTATVRGWVCKAIERVKLIRRIHVALVELW